MRIREWSLLLSCLLLPALGQAGVVIEKVVPFVTADRVRLQVALRSDGPAQELRLSAEIKPLPQGQTLWKGEMTRSASKRGRRPPSKS